jgi:type I restriction-modification system DNA methylase subunit/restriction endonuclease S subunit
MLDKDTKKKIDDARDTLVGVLPLPTDQIELITIALIYKFMDDQDEELRQVGLQEKFFTGALKEFSWQQLMSNQLSADQRVTKFINGIEAIQKAKQVPNLFREIFLNAFLKFRDGKVLQLFLDIINGFTYDHSEELGNSFEYLLMTMGAQGDNGQFRTPRNIIDFIVEVADPQKDETILDPACGTGGFLVSAFKHILKRNTAGYETAKVELENYVAEGIPVYWGAKLSSSERNTIEKNIVGYDNTPLMVRLARVNLYLHHFGNPQIHEYNTLITDTRWKDKYDCILANPPFMTPKGGIDPHDKFRIPANRTEILFSSYILQHLNPDGKAGFVVPEGIIFSTSGDYVTLRNWLIYEAGLWAAVSLPAHIFQPYSGVKTSILFIDREIARKRNEILLVKIDNDGFSLNTNRNPIKDNDLPAGLEWMELCKKDLEQFQKDIKTKADTPFVSKLRLLHRDEFAKLDSYKATSTIYTFCKKQHERSVKLYEEIEFLIAAEKLKQDGEKNNTKIQKSDDAIETLEEKKEKVLGDLLKKTGIPELFETEKQLKEWFDETIKQDIIEYGSNLINTNNLTKDIIELIDATRDFNLSFERFETNSASKNSIFPLMKIGEIAKTQSGGTPNRDKKEYFENGTIPWLKSGEVNQDLIIEAEEYITEEALEHSSTKIVPKNSILVAMYGATAGQTAHLKINAALNQAICAVIPKENVLPEFLFWMLKTQTENLIKLSTGGAQQNLSQKIIQDFVIPVPDLNTQQSIVSELNQYKKVIDGSKAMVENYAPSFKIQEDWDDARIIDVADFVRGPFGGSLKKEIFVERGYLVYEQSHAIQNDFSLGRYFIDEEKFQEMKRFEVLPNDILMSCSGTMGKVALVPEDAKQGIINQALLKLTPKQDLIRPLFLKLLMETPHFQIQLLKGVSGVAIKNVASVDEIKRFEIKLPDLETQDRLIEEYEAEQRTLNGSIALANKMQDEILFVIDKVWGK